MLFIVQKISENKPVERIPKQFENIQVNFCKKTTCPNFAIPAKQAEFGTKQVRGDNVLSLFAVNTMANNSNIDSCEAITTLYNNGELKAAIEETRWCLGALEQIHKDQINAIFLEEIDAWLTSRSLSENRKPTAKKLILAIFSYHFHLIEQLLASNVRKI